MSAITPLSSLFNSVPGDNQYGAAGTGLPSSPVQGSAPTQGTDFSIFATPTASGSVSSTPPGVVPPQQTPVSDPTGTAGQPAYNPGNVSGVQQQANGISTLMPQDPNFSQEFNNYLQSQVGTGATPFDLSTILPSSGQATGAGQVNAPLTQLLQQLQQFYSTGQGGPAGSSQLLQNATTGNPTDVGPAWQAMIASQAQNTAQNANNLREQFAFGGDLASSPFGNAMQQFYNQNTLNQNAQLTQAQQQAQEAAAGRQLTASTTLNDQSQALGNNLQTLDQTAIQNMLAEFIRTSPDYSPLLNLQSASSNTYPPSTATGSGLSGSGAIAASAGTALQGIADLWSTLNQ